MAASPGALLLSRFRHFSTASFSPPTPNPLLFSSRHLLHLRRTRESDFLSSAVVLPPGAVGCLLSGFDGGGVADDFVSTRRSGRREFSALANVLRRIEPLDTAVIAKGVSAPAKDSMKRTISTMLGLLPSDQFDVSIRVSKEPLHHLLLSSIITGYTLWNAEYRVSLMRNFESSPGRRREVLMVSRGGFEVFRKESKKNEVMDEDEVRGIDGDKEIIVPENLENLSPTVLNYIQELESELASAQKELDAQKQEKFYLENSKENNSDLLNYLRSLEPDMVWELSRPSSSEVEEIIKQLAQDIYIRIFNGNAPDLSQVSSEMTTIGGHPENDVNESEAITTRDYLAKLLFWCMLLGHHLRGLEYRLQLSCVVGSI